MDFNKFDKMVDLEGLAKDLEEVEANGGNSNYKQVPHGEYEVSVNKLEVGETKTGKPKVATWFKVLAGEYKGSLIFWNQVIESAFQIHIVNEFLESLESGVEVMWPGSYGAYNDLLLDVAEAIDGVKEYALDYGKRKGFDTFKILEVFDVE